MYELDYCGVNSRHREPFEMKRETGLGTYTLLLVKTPGDFCINERLFSEVSGRVILIPPGMSFRYGCKEPGYNDDWLHFTCLSEEWDLEIPFGVPLPVRDLGELSHYLHLLFQESLRGGKRKKELEHLLIRSLLILLERQISSSCVKNGLDLSKTDKFRQKMYQEPEQEYHSSELAGELGISVSYLEHLYKECYGISFRQDLIRARMEKARLYLTKTSMSVEEIANACGYPSQEHFMRQFRRMWGMTALQYRKRF